MKSFVLMVLGFVAGIVVGRSMGSWQNGGTTQSSGRRRPAPRPVPQGTTAAPSAPAAPAGPPLGEEWFKKQMKAYEEALLAHFVSKFCLEKGASAAQTMELYKQYGRMPLLPTLAEYEAGFREQGLSVAALGELAVAWLRGQGVEASAQTWEEKAATHLEARQSQKAEQIVREALAQ